MERQLDDLVSKLETNNDVQLDIVKILKQIEGTIINRKFIVNINRNFLVNISGGICFKLLSDGLTKCNVNDYKINNNINLNHICICFPEKQYLEIFIIPTEKNFSEIHINGTNIQMDYFQNYLQIINNILKK